MAGAQANKITRRALLGGVSGGAVMAAMPMPLADAAPVPLGRLLRSLLLEVVSMGPGSSPGNGEG